MSSVIEPSATPTAEVSVGDLVTDRDNPGGEPAVVINNPPISLAEWDVDDTTTAADQNPGYRPDAPVVVTIARDAIQATYPYYCGVSPLRLADVSRRGIELQAFPQNRVARVGGLEYPVIDVADLRPAPYHARSFNAADNQGFIERTQARGELHRAPLVRADPDDGLEIIDGHKRVWAGVVAGLHHVQCRCVYTDAASAARGWVTRHLADYTPREQATALQRLEDRFGPDTTRDLVRGVIEQ